MATRVRRSTLKIDNGRLQISLKQAIPRDVVSEWESIFEEVGAKRFPRALQWAVNRVAKDAQRYIGEEIDATIDNPALRCADQHCRRRQP